VIVDCLKLTTYFGERDRAGGQLLADRLLGLYGERELRTSVLLRGIEGFGARHRMHTDALLSLSEDLPVVSVAVDARDRIEAVLPEVLALQRRGLVTLERAGMLSGGLARAQLPPELAEATKLTVYLGRRERVGPVPAFHAVCDLLHRRELAGATVALGVDGTRHGQRARARFVARNADVPLMIVAVGSGAQIGGVLPELAERLREPIVTLERVRVCKRDGERLAAPHALPATDEHGLALWQKLMIHASEGAIVGGHPLHRAIVRRLRQDSDVAGATSVRGIWGFHGAHRPHGDRLLQARRHVPVVTIVVDRPERIARAFAIVDALTVESGLVTSEMVPAAAGGDARAAATRLARHRF
jgi:PII-like signaling protein